MPFVRFHLARRLKKLQTPEHLTPCFPHVSMFGSWPGIMHRCLLSNTKPCFNSADISRSNRQIQVCFFFIIGNRSSLWALAHWTTYSLPCTISSFLIMTNYTAKIFPKCLEAKQPTISCWKGGGRPNVCIASSKTVLLSVLINARFRPKK